MLVCCDIGCVSVYKVNWRWLSVKQVASEKASRMNLTTVFLTCDVSGKNIVLRALDSEEVKCVVHENGSFVYFNYLPRCVWVWVCVGVCCGSWTRLTFESLLEAPRRVNAMSCLAAPTVAWVHTEGQETWGTSSSALSLPPCCPFGVWSKHPSSLDHVHLILMWLDHVYLSTAAAADMCWHVFRSVFLVQTPLPCPVA